MFRTSKKQELLELYNKNRHLTSKEYGKILGVSDSTIKTWFKELGIKRQRHKKGQRPAEESVVEEKKPVVTHRNAMYYGRAYSPTSRGYLRLM